MVHMQKYPDQKNKEAFDILTGAVSRLRRDKPFVIGITGAGGAGKTTFGNNISHFYGKNNCVSIDLDDYLISREERGKLGLTGYHPKANRLIEARQNIEQLVKRKTILKIKYDHKTGKSFERKEKIEPKEIIIIEGVTTLYPELKELNDLSFFLDAGEETQLMSRIERDVKHRGYSLEEAITLLNVLKEPYRQFIEPTKKYANAVFIVGTDYVMNPIRIDVRLR